MTLVQLTSFLGWCTLLNIGLLTFSAVFIVLFNNFTMAVHSKLMSVPKTELPKLYFSFLAYYKIAVLIFNLVPYLALKIMILD